MKILMITHGFPPECSGGTESHVQRLCRELIELGHKVEVLCGSHEGAGVGNWEPQLRHSEYHGIPVHRLHRTGLFVDNWEKSLAPEVEPLLQYLIKDFSPDIVHVHHWIRLTRNLVEICHDLGIPAVCTLHDLWTTCPIAFRVREETHCGRDVGPTNCVGCVPGGENMSEDEIQRELALFRDDTRNELDLVRRVIVPSNAHRDVVLAHMPWLQGKFRVVNHGNISTLRRRRPRKGDFPSGPLRIGHWGHLSFFKGLDVLLEALQGFEHREEVELELFGEVVYPGERERVDELAKDLNITWHGAYRPKALTKVPMDIAIIPSRCSESWSFVLDEAFLLGLPAIVPDRGALAERINGAGAIYLADDARDLRRVLGEIFKSPELLEQWKLCIAPLPLMRQHTRSIESVYHEVLSSRAPLPRTPPALRARRLHVRSYQLEARNRQMEDEQGRIKNLESDYGKAKKTLEEMEYYHGEKDKELDRLSGVVENFNENNVDLEALKEVAKAKEDLADEARKARDELVETARKVKTLEKKDRKKQRRVERTRSDLEDMSTRIVQLEKDLGEQQKSAQELQAENRELSDTRTQLERERDELTESRGTLEATSIELKRRRDELEQSVATRSAEMGSLEEKLTEVLRTKHSLVTRGEERISEVETELQNERTAMRSLRETLESQQNRLKVLEGHGTTLGDRLKSLGSNLSEIVHDVSTRLDDKDLTALTDGRAPESDALDCAPTNGGDGDDSLARELDRAESDVTRIIDHVVDRQGWLQTQLGQRDQLILEMAKSLDGLLDTVESLERKRRGTTSSGTSKTGVKRPGDRLKVLMVVHQYLPHHVAGTEVYTHNLAKELSRRHDVLVLSAESDHSRPRFEESRHEVDGVPVHQVIHNYKWDHFRETYDCPEADAIFRRVVREEQPDIVHIQHLHYFSANFVTIARSRGIPVVYTLHDYMLMCPRDGTLRREDGELCEGPAPANCRDCIAHHDLADTPAPVLPRALRPGIDAIVTGEVTRVVRRTRVGESADDPFEEAAAERLDYVRRVLTDVDLFISPSKFLRQKFIDSGLVDADAIIASDNGYDLSRLPQAAPRVHDPSRLRVAYVGTIAEHKGIHVLIEAMNGIEDPRVTCKIWGDLTAFDAYTNHLRYVTRNDRTLLMGPFENGRIAEVLGQTDLLVVPSLWFENSPLTVHEAAACGVPVLTSDQGGLAEYVTPEVTGRHFRLGGVEDLREKILSFLTDPIAAFDPASLELKSIQDDARDMERRYYKLLSRVDLLVG
ncbi:MAG: hypothetical protein CMJ83_10270 [Planctomycetes bacterium]|nr:hypothetical protein [Planctomycetota bacterium]